MIDAAPAKPGTSLQDRLAQELSDEIERTAQAVARDQGQPLGTKPASEADELRLWARNDPLANYDQILQMLLTTGVPQPMLTVPDGANPRDPKRQWLVIAKEQPDLIPQYAAPTQDADLAHRLAVLAEYPFRMGVLMDIDDPDEQVRKANHLDKLWSTMSPQAQAVDEPTPTPDQVEPQSPPPMPQPPTPPMPAGAPMQPTMTMGG